MYKIYFDTTKRYEHILRLSKDTEVIEELTGDFDVTCEIAKLLKKHNLKPDDIASYETNPGPGSFMGIKIGVTVANVLNFILGKKQFSDLQQAEYDREPNITVKA